MLEIPLKLANGSIDDDDEMSILGVMLYPRDAEARAAFHEGFAIEAKRKSLKIDQPGGNGRLRAATATEVVEYLAERPPMDELLAGTLKRGGFGGPIAGSILLTVLRLNAHYPSKASITKAIRVQEYHWRRIKGANESRMREEWSQFKPVAHLWGIAFWLTSLKQPMPKTPDQWAGFLAMAEELLRMAAAVVPHKNSSAGLIEPADCWRAPSNLTLPGPVNLPAFAALSDQELAEIKN